MDGRKEKTTTKSSVVVVVVVVWLFKFQRPKCLALVILEGGGILICSLCCTLFSKRVHLFNHHYI